MSTETQEQTVDGTWMEIHHDSGMYLEPWVKLCNINVLQPIA
jgi:hypothetical protein